MSSSSTPQADPAATDRAAAPPAAEVPGDAAGRGWAATGRVVQANARTNAQSDGAQDFTAMSSPKRGAHSVSEHCVTFYHARHRLTAGKGADRQMGDRAPLRRRQARGFAAYSARFMRLLTRSSTTVGSARVETSPNWLG